MSHPTTDIVQEVEAAEARIRPHVRQTPLEWSPALSELSGAHVFLKCENLQHTGSFKVRGALSKVLSLSPEEIARGVITASTGNHGAAVAYALGKLGASAAVFVPEGASPAKVAAIERLGGTVRRHGTDSGETEAFARRHATESGAVFVSPYNDPRVIGGQGTIGIELLRQLPDLDAALVSLGGGGLISGIAAYLKANKPGVRVIGCSPENSQVMIKSVAAGWILDLPSLPTLSDGTAGGVEADSMTFPLVRDLVDDFVTVTEEEIASAMRRCLEVHHMLIEGSAGVALAAFEKQAAHWRGKHVVIVLCGANISLPALRSVISE
ncbi:MAG: threonine/serine dehydratase [Hyphomicrobiaceae bacterium]|nr:MAG: threonine/serine dehydratase [Hyphomicrobiaceae bacterium]